MSLTNSTNGATNEAINSPFLKTIVQQLRGQDTYGVYRSWSDDLILKPYIISKQKKREISLEGEVDPITQSRIVVFYRAIAACIEKETGLISQVVVDLNHEGFGWSLVFAGRLLLVMKTLRDAHRCGFESFEKMVEEGERLISKGIDLAKTFPEVGKI